MSTSQTSLPSGSLKAPIVVDGLHYLFGGNYSLEIVPQSGLLTLIGPNGSGKTHVLRRIADILRHRMNPVRFISSGRMGLLEQYRSDVFGVYGQPFAQSQNVSLGQQNQTASRHRSESVAGDFLALQERPDLRIKVEARLQGLFGRRLFLEWSQHGLQVNFASTATADKYSVTREASGLIHLVGLLAALYDDSTRALLIDEPEVSLHPQLQSFLLAEMTEVAGDPGEREHKLIIIATHSPSMLSVTEPKDLEQVVFFRSSILPPIQIVGAPELLGQQIRRFVLRLSESYKQALFAEVVVLVEGPSDQIVATALAAKLRLALAASGVQIVSVLGKGEMAPATKLFRIAGKTVLIVADLDALIDGADLVNVIRQNPNADSYAVNKGHASLSELFAGVRENVEQMIDSAWEEVAPHAEKHPYWVFRDKIEDDRKARRRAMVATLLSIGDEALTSLPSLAKWISLRTRLDAALACLIHEN